MTEVTYEHQEIFFISKQTKIYACAKTDSIPVKQ